jgi:hypothetical protein
MFKNLLNHIKKTEQSVKTFINSAELLLNSNDSSCEQERLYHRTLRQHQTHKKFVIGKND